MQPLRNRYQCCSQGHWPEVSCLVRFPTAVQADRARKPRPLLQKIFNQLVAEATGDVKKSMEAAAYDAV